MTEHRHEDAEQELLHGDPDTTGHSWDGIKEFNNPLLPVLPMLIYGAIGLAIMLPMAETNDRSLDA